MDRLEDLVWKLYSDLEIRIQSVFDDHIIRFQNQNDLVTNIFNGLTSEMQKLKSDVIERRNVSEYEKDHWQDYDKSKNTFSAEIDSIYYSRLVIDCFVIKITIFLIKN